MVGNCDDELADEDKAEFVDDGEYVNNLKDESQRKNILTH